MNTAMIAAEHFRGVQCITEWILADCGEWAAALVFVPDYHTDAVDIQGWWCGYAIMDTTEIMYDDDMVDQVIVHGGVTLHETIQLGVRRYTIIGFDCAHAMDEYRPETKDREWLLGECKKMHDGFLEIAAAQE